MLQYFVCLSSHRDDDKKNKIAAKFLHMCRTSASDVKWILNVSLEMKVGTLMCVCVCVCVSGGPRRSCTWWSCSSTTCSTTSRRSENTGTSLHCKSVGASASVTRTQILRFKVPADTATCSLQVQPQCGGPGPAAVPHLRLLHAGISRPLQ